MLLKYSIQLSKLKLYGEKSLELKVSKIFYEK